MLINGPSLLDALPIRTMIPTKEWAHGFSHGLSEVGYDIRVKQQLHFYPPNPMRAFELWENRHAYRPALWEDLFLKAFHGYTEVYDPESQACTITPGRTILASSIEYFQIPSHLWCEFRNKSTHARLFCDFTIGTDGEPGWNGHLTIEGIFDGLEERHIPAGAGILKAVFHEIAHPASYQGKYQNQADEPVPAKFSE